MAEDIDILQELLDTESAVSALGFPLNAAASIAAVKDLRRLAPSQDAAGVCRAWEQLGGAVGPKLLAAILSTGEWQRFCPLQAPLDEHAAGDLMQEVWVGNGRKVVARAIMDGDTFVGLKFTDEPR